MNFKSTLKYLYDILPYFSNKGYKALNYNLENISKFVIYLGNPHLEYKVIHIGGTNGKGSCSSSLYSILKECNYKVGLYTSPHLIDFRERIQVNGMKITKKYVVEFIKKHKNYIDANKLTFFEVSLGMAFDFYKFKKVEVVVLEVGLGGRLDATNVCKSCLSIVTNISFDHTHVLGNTIREIATEKAGIFKEKIPIIIGETNPESQKVFNDFAQKLECEINYADFNFKVANFIKNDNNLFVDIIDKDNNVKYNKLKLDLVGDYQKKNILTILNSVEVLNMIGFNISKKKLKKGLSKVKVNSGLRGRWDKIHNNPKIICDVGHNPDGIKNVMYNILQEKYNKLHLILSFVKDKDIETIFTLLPKDAKYYFFQLPIFRGVKIEYLENLAKKFELDFLSFNSFTDIMKHLKPIKQYKDDLIFVGGSTFAVTECFKYFKKK